MLFRDTSVSRNEVAGSGGETNEKEQKNGNPL